MKTAFVLLLGCLSLAAQSDQNLAPCVNVGGSANAITCTLPFMNVYPNNWLINVVPTAANTGAATINVNKLGAIPIQIANGALNGGELQASSPTTLRCSPFSCQLTGPSYGPGGSLTVGTTILNPGSSPSTIITNSSTGGVGYAILSQPSIITPTKHQVAVWGNLLVGGDLSSTGWSLQGINGNCNITGALTAVPNASTHCIGVEGDATIASTGQTLPSVRGVFGGVSVSAGSTTNVTEAASLYGGAISNAGGGTITNAYSLILEAQTVGTTGNFSAWLKGPMLQGSDIYLGGTTSSFVRIHPNSGTFTVQLADGSQGAPISGYTFSPSRSGGAVNFPDIYGSSGGLCLADVVGHNTQICLQNGKLLISGIPTSSAGLTSGMVWSNSNVLTIIP